MLISHEANHGQCSFCRLSANSLGQGDQMGSVSKTHIASSHAKYWVRPGVHGQLRTREPNPQTHFIISNDVSQSCVSLEGMTQKGPAPPGVTSMYKLNLKHQMHTGRGGCFSVTGLLLQKAQALKVKAGRGDFTAGKQQNIHDCEVQSVILCIL